MGLEEPEIQVEIRDARGHLLGRVDFYFRSRRLVIEIDGKGKYDEPGAIWKEKLREDRIREMDLEFLRLSWADLVGDPQALRARVDAAFARADRRLLTRSRQASLVSPGLRSSPGAGEGWGRRVRAGANE